MGVARNWIGAAILLLAGSWMVSAQVVANRVSEEINPLSTVKLQGSVSPFARTASDLGQMSGGTRIQGVTLYFALSPAQKASLDALLRAQQTPGSSAYHKWLTPAEYAARFGISDSDLEKIKNWLEQQGFSIGRVSNSRTSISFSGTIAQVESAFSTQMRRYSVGGETHFANATALSIPAALDGVVAAVRNLDDFRPKPHLRIQNASSSKVSPLFTSGSSGSSYLTPGDVATIYSVDQAYNAGYDGTGQSIAVVGQSAVVTSDITKFLSAANLSERTPTVVLVPDTGSSTINPNGSSAGDEAESDLDLEYTSGIARGADIYFVYTGSNTNYGVFDSMAYAIDTRIAPIISVSYGSCETEMSQNTYTQLENILKQGAAQGQSIIASSGDDGSTSCYDFTDLTTAQQNALATSYPATSAYVTALGGTMFPVEDICKTLSSTATTATCGANAANYWMTSSGSDTIQSAKSYIPEVVWNNNSSNGLSSGGGGVSVWTARPDWQTGVTGIATAPDYAKVYRMVPDLSLASSPSNAGYLYCSSDSKATGVSGSCTNGFRDVNNQYLTVAGGTSFAAPVFAGMLAILNQARNYNYQGLINSTLYSLASNAATYSSVFNDITSGNNACSGISTCTTSGSSYYSATTGYDEATGLGSINFYNLMMTWPAATASVAGASYGSTTTLTAASSTVTSGTSDTITMTVDSNASSSTVTPTGTLTVYVDGTKETSSLALASGSAIYSFSSTTSGAHTIMAEYSGDANYYASSGSVVVTVGSSSSTTGSGGSGTSLVTVTPSGGYTGTVAFALSTSNSYLQKYACFTLPSASVAGTSAVSSTLTLYLGSANCSSASSAAKGAVRSFKAASAGEAAAAPRSLSIAQAALGGIGLLLAGLVGWRFRRVRSLMALLVVAVLGIALNGCGSSSSSSSSSQGFTIALSPATMTVSAGTSGVPTGSYSITIEGDDSSDSTISSTKELTLIVD